MKILTRFTIRAYPYCRHILLLSACALVIQGCITVQAPLTKDASYPAQWSKISTLGSECKNIAGTYSNKGDLTVSNEAVQTVYLTNLFNLHRTAKSVSLGIYTRNMDENGDTFSTLEVVPDGDTDVRHTFENCFCVKQTLACTQVAKKAWRIPNFGLVGSQTNVYFSISEEKALIVKLQNYSAGVILGMPLFSKTEPWARFNKN